MFKDLFSNRLFIGALAFFILCVGGSLLYMRHVEQTEAVKLAETKEFQQWWQERNTPPQTVAAEVAKSDDADDVSHPEAVGDTAVVGAATDEPEPDNTPDFWSLSPEEQQQIFDQFYLQHGLKPPPKGYKYRWKDIGVPLLDENGNPVLQKEGEPWVTVQYGIGFAPTREEYEKYEQLQEDQGWAESRGDVAEVARLTAEIEALEASVQRMRPLGATSIAVGAEASSKSSRRSKEKLNAALREYDLEHLISPY
ncbi:MAG: hypothetical protein OXL96_11055 [Candidatus Poribacteria bacterium]|nr:hypothetical protein [Candidatus Poribacteria bacterium]